MATKQHARLIQEHRHMLSRRLSVVEPNLHAGKGIAIFTSGGDSQGKYHLGWWYCSPITRELLGYFGQ